jgi:uncharacterized membrane protein (UPF0127 family)
MARRIGYAFNVTRQTFLATELRVAYTHWGRLMGLLRTSKASFSGGRGLWINPCHGVHTIAMRYPIDVLYLDEKRHIIHVEENVKPWRVTPMRMDAATVIELPAHTAWNTGSTIGDQVEINFENGNGSHGKSEAVAKAAKS